MSSLQRHRLALFGLTLALAAGTPWQAQRLSAQGAQLPQAAVEPLPAGAVARLGSIRFRHGDAITSMSVSKDGQSVVAVSAGRPAGISVWNVADGTLRRRFGDRIYQDAAFLPDGKTLALGTWEAGVSFVDLATGAKKHHVATPNGAQRIALSPEGKLLASWHSDSEEDKPGPRTGKNIVCVLDVASGKLVKRIERQHDPRVVGDISAGMSNGPGVEIEFWNIRFLAFTGDNKSVASAGWDKSIFLWEKRSGEWAGEFGGVKQPAYCFALSREGDALAAACSDGSVRGLNMAKHKPTFTIPLGMQRVQGMAFAPGGKFLAVCGVLLEGNRWITGDAVWDLATGKRICNLPTFGSCVAFLPDGKTLLVGDGNGVIRLFEPATGKEIRPQAGHRGNVLGLAFAPDGKTLVSESDDRTIRWWDVAKTSQINQCEGYCVTMHSALVFSADGRQMGSRGDDGTITVRDAVSGKEVCALRGHRGLIYPLAFAPDGQTLVSSERDGPAIVWNIEQAKPTRQFSHRFGGGETVALSSDGALLAVAKCYGRAPFDGPHECGIWDTATGKEVKTFEITGTQPPAKFAFTPDKKALIAGTYNGLVSIVDVRSGKETRRLTAHDHWVQCLAVSPDGNLLATSGGFKQHVRLWDLQTGRRVAAFPALGTSIHALAFSPDSTLLASGGGDGIIVIWDARNK